MKPSEIVESYAKIGMPFRLSADKNINEWKPDEPPITLLLAAFAQVTADLAREGSKDGAPSQPARALP